MGADKIVTRSICSIVVTQVGTQRHGTTASVTGVGSDQCGKKSRRPLSALPTKSWYIFRLYHVYPSASVAQPVETAILAWLKTGRSLIPGSVKGEQENFRIGTGGSFGCFEGTRRNKTEKSAPRAYFKSNAICARARRRSRIMCL